jgi:hypothetical protein
LKLPPRKRAALASRLILSLEKEKQDLSPEEWSKGVVADLVYYYG